MRLYRNEPNWIPPLVAERRAFLDRRKNPFFGHADVELFLAWRDGQPVGRISAHVDRHLNDFQRNEWGLFGFFECEDDPEVAGALLDTAEGWLRERGRDRMVGPMDFTTNDECGLLVEGHERPPLILEGWHHPYYLELLEGWGLKKAMDLYMWELRLDKVEDKGGFHPLIHATAKKVTDEHGVTVRNMRRNDLEAEIGHFLEVYNAAWEGQLGVRATRRDRGPLVHQEPPPGAGRDVDVDRRARRRGAGRGSDPAGRQRGAGAHERAAAAVRLGEVPLVPAQDPRAAGCSPWG